MAFPAALVLPALALLDSCIAASVIVHTDATSWIRLPVVLTFAYLAYLEVLAAVDFTPSFLLNGIAASAFFVRWIHHANLLWINPINRRDLPLPEAAKKGLSTGLGHLLSAFALTWNLRGIGTKWQTKNIPKWSAFYQPGNPPSRAAFLARQAVLLCWEYLVLDLLFFLPTLQSVEEQQKTFEKGLEFRYLGLTAEQWTVRVASTALTWTLGRIMIQCGHRTLSVIFVGSGLSRPEDWPPLFASIWEAYSLRNFWG
jgi:hypothetical protein